MCVSLFVSTMMSLSDSAMDWSVTSDCDISESFILLKNIHMHSLSISLTDFIVLA